MKYDFGFTHYFLDPPDLSSIEVFFVQVQAKLNIHQRHSQTTVRLYQGELEGELQMKNEDLNKALATANEDYKKFFAETEGTDEDKHAIAMHESGIDEIQHYFNTIDEQIKLDYVAMADHYSKSAVATLYALLEGELRRLCGHAMSYFGLSFPVERFEKSDYLFSMIEYLKLVAHIDTSKAETYLPKLQELQFLRNKIMHNGAEFSLEKNEKLDKLLNDNKGLLSLDKLEGEAAQILRIRSKFIEPYYKIFSEFFYELFESLNTKTKFTFLDARMSFIFGFLNRDVKAQLTAVADVKKGRHFVYHVKSEVLKFEFNLKMTITCAKLNSVDVTNQLGEIKNLERWIQQMTTNGEVLRQALVGYLVPYESYQIQMLLSPVEP